MPKIKTRTEGKYPNQTLSVKELEEEGWVVKETYNRVNTAKESRIYESPNGSVIGVIVDENEMCKVNVIGDSYISFETEYLVYWDETPDIEEEFQEAKTVWDVEFEAPKFETDGSFDDGNVGSEVVHEEPEQTENYGRRVKLYTEDDQFMYLVFEEKGRVFVTRYDIGASGVPHIHDGTWEFESFNGALEWAGKFVYRQNFMWNLTKQHSE